MISAVNLPKPNGAATKGDVIDPFVKLELFGTATDCADFRTRTIANSGEKLFHYIIHIYYIFIFLYSIFLYTYIFFKMLFMFIT